MSLCRPFDLAKWNKNPEFDSLGSWHMWQVVFIKALLLFATIISSANCDWYNIIYFLFLHLMPHVRIVIGIAPLPQAIIISFIRHIRNSILLQLNGVIVFPFPSYTTITPSKELWKKKKRCHSLIGLVDFPQTVCLRLWDVPIDFRWCTVSLFLPVFSWYYKLQDTGFFIFLL